MINKFYMINNIYMNKSRGEKNKDLYNFFYKKGKMDSTDIYTKKLYNRNFTEEDKTQVDSSFAFRKSPMTQKHFLMFFIICMIALYYGHFYYDNDDNITSILFIILFFFSAVGVFYDVKANFYLVLLGLIIFTLLIVSGTAMKAFNYAVDELIPDKKGNANNNNKSNNNKANNKK
jgi:hypothetical protein